MTLLHPWKRTCAIFLFCSATAIGAPAQTFTKLVDFDGTNDAYPYYNREGMLHSFVGKDGADPTAGLIFDAAGNLYGTTAGDSYGNGGLGTVFMLSPIGDGKWTRTVLHRFSGGDGTWPIAGLVFDATGNLYGATWVGGTYDYGTVFELVHRANGSWTEKVLHSFDGYDGYDPYPSLIFDAAGNLYGTTFGGFGNVFKLALGANGEWTETVLHTFNGTDGDIVYAGLTFDAAGNLYGTTQQGGAFSDCNNLGCGAVFKLAPGSTGWKETVLHSFNGKDGAFPDAGLIFDAAGNLYGTTNGDPYGYGTVFKLARSREGDWTATILHAFRNIDGAYPTASLVSDTAGNLYGTTVVGGNLALCSTNAGQGCGVVFEITNTPRLELPPGVAGAGR